MKKETKMISVVMRYQTKSSYPCYNKVSFVMEVKVNTPMDQLMEEVNDYFKKQVNKDELVEWYLKDFIEL